MNERITSAISVTVPISGKTDTFNIVDATDTTKKLAFNVAPITTGVTRTLLSPNANSLLLAYNSSSLACLSSLPAGINNTFYGVSAGSDVTSGTGNLIFGSSAAAGTSSAVNRIVFNTTGVYDNTCHIPSTYLHVPNLASAVTTAVLYFDSVTGRITQGTIASTADILDGTVTAPGLKFSSDTNTGIYRPASDTIAFATGGVKSMQLIATQLEIISGTNLAPAYSFLTDLTTGMYNPSGNQISFATNATEVFRITTNQIISIPDGSAATPSIAFATSTSTGLYYSASAINFSIAGTQKMKLDASRLSIQNGSSTNPSVSFLGDLTTGFYLSSSHSVSVATGSVQDVIFSNGQIRMTETTTAGAASIVGASDTTTGITFTGGIGLILGGSYAISIYNATKQPSASSAVVSCVVPCMLPTTGTRDFPSLTFNNEFSTAGLYLGGGGLNTVIGCASRTDVFQWNSSGLFGLLQIIGKNGTSSSPGFGFTSDTTTGFYYSSGIIGSIAGTDVLSILSGGTTTVGNATITGSGNGIVWRRSTTNRWKASVSTASESGANAGSNFELYNFDDSGTQIGLVMSIVRSTGITTFANNVLFADGSASTPSISFSADTNTGMYRQGSDLLGFTTGGVLALSVSTSAVYSTLVFRGALGSASAPGFAFTSETNTGFYQPAASSGQISFSGSGVQYANLSSGGLNLYNTTNVGVTLASLSSGARWRIYFADTETGSNAGSTFYINAYNDAGSLTSTPVSIRRSDGQFTHNTSVMPGANNTLSLGNASTGWASVYAGAFYATGGPSSGFAFSTDTLTGLFTASSSQVKIRLGGAQGALFDPSLITFNAPVYIANTSSSTTSLNVQTTGNDVGTILINGYTPTSGASNFKLLALYTDAKSNLRFVVNGDGSYSSDGAYTTPAADYAEYFQSTDGKDLEIGQSVVVDNGLVRLATLDDMPSTIIGVVRPKKNARGPNVIGNDTNEQIEKYLLDDFGCFIEETVTMVQWNEGNVQKQQFEDDLGDTKVPDNAQRIQKSRWKRNPNYSENPTRCCDIKGYILVGLLGQIPLKKNAIKNPNWIRLKETGTSDIYLVR